MALEIFFKAYILSFPVKTAKTQNLILQKLQQRKNCW